MRLLLGVLLTTICGPFALAGGGGGGYEIAQYDLYLSCIAPNKDGYKTELKIGKELRNYDEGAYTFYTLSVKYGEKQILVESHDLKDLLLEGNPQKGTVQKTPVLNYLESEGEPTAMESGVLEMNLKPGKGGSLKAWLYDYGKHKITELRLDVRFTDCTIEGKP